MDRITSGTMARRVLADISAANTRLTRTQQKLASGRELNQPSDDPAAVGRAIHLRREMEAAQQYQRNASEAQGWAEVTDAALSAVSAAVQRARDLAVQASNDAGGTEVRGAIAQELATLIDSVKEAGNASYGGRYVFAGSQTNVKPYEMGLDDTFRGDGADVKRAIGPGVDVKVNISGETFIGNGPTQLIGILRTILGHVQTGTSGQISADLEILDKRIDQLNAVRATAGAVTNRVESALGRLEEYEGTTLKLLDNVEAADMAKAMIDFSTQQAALTAGLKAGANIVQNSLLDFLR